MILPKYGSRPRQEDTGHLQKHCSNMASDRWGRSTYQDAYYHPSFSPHILTHIGTMKLTYINNVFFDYNYVSPTNLKESFYGIGLIFHHTKSFSLRNMFPTWDLITVQIGGIYNSKKIPYVHLDICRPTTPDYITECGHPFKFHA